MEEICIRKFAACDRSAVRDIAWETAFLGRPAQDFFQGKEILADFLTLYFTDHEPQSCFVAQGASGVVGYCIGSTDGTALTRTFCFKIMPKLLARFLLSGSFLKFKNMRFIAHLLISAIRGEFAAADVSRAFPAVMHINIKEGFRDRGIGRRLITTFCDYLRQQKVYSVHLATMSDRAAEFFRQQGFQLLGQYRRSYFHYLLHRDITVYVFGKNC